MRKRGLCLFVSCMLLTACQNAGDTSETFEEHAYEANTEYDSVEEFLEDSNETMFVLGNKTRQKNIAADANAGMQLYVEDTGVTVGEVYASVTYECEVGEDRFKVNLATYNYSDGEGSMQYIIDNNSDAFSEEEIGGRTVYYCPCPDIEEYNCYLMVWEGKMFVLNIEKGYDSYVEMIMAYIE